VLPLRHLLGNRLPCNNVSPGGWPLTSHERRDQFRSYHERPERGKKANAERPSPRSATAPRGPCCCDGASPA